MKIRFADPETGQFTETELKMDNITAVNIKLVGTAGEDIKRGDYLMIDPDTGLVVNCGIDVFGTIYRIKK